MRKNIYQRPLTAVVDIAFVHVLMASGGGTPPAGNVNNTSEDNIIGG